LDNAFWWLADPQRAQRFADRFTDLNWPRILHVFARRACPLLKDFLATMEYYWVVDQAEYATDVLFKDRASLKGLYEKLLRHATLCFSAEDVLTFLGRKLHGCFLGEVLNDCKRRWPGARVKHRMKENWIKMYDKHGLVLRIETVINHPHEFKVRRRGRRNGQEVMGWYPMTKGVGYFYRQAAEALPAGKLSWPESPGTESSRKGRSGLVQGRPSGRTCRGWLPQPGHRQTCLASPQCRSV
jgi:hypothetical protein